MADKKISDFTAVTTLADADLAEIETAGGNSRKITVANLKATLGITFRGALVYASGDQTSLNHTSGAAVSFNSEEYDTDSIHGLAATVTITIATPGVVTWTGHDFLAGSPIVLTTTGALPTGLAINTVYYVVSPAANTFQLALTPGGAAINTTGSQSGVHTGTNYSRLTVPSGVSKVRLGGAILANNVSASTDCLLAFSKNGGAYSGTPNFNGSGQAIIDTSNTSPRGSVTSRVVTVTPGDYFELVWRTVGDTSSDIAAIGSDFGMEIIE